MKLLGYLVVLVVVGSCWSAPQGDEAPMPYSYNWEVNDVDEEQNKLYFGAEETGNEAGRTEGEYRVLLADGRLMTVKYFVDGESGFVPEITFTDAFQPPPPSARK